MWNPVESARNWVSNFERSIRDVDGTVELSVNDETNVSATICIQLNKRIGYYTVWLNGPTFDIFVAHQHDILPLIALEGSLSEENDVERHMKLVLDTLNS